MPDLNSALLIISVAFVAALVSSMCGGGSSMITTPVWLMLGFPLPVAIAANTVTGAVWTLIAARNYLRGHTIDWRLVAATGGSGLLGTYFATKVIVSADPKMIQRFFGGFIIALVLLVFCKKDFGLMSKEPRAGRVLTGLLALPLGFYEAFFGSGNGLFTSAMLCTARGFTLLEALGYYYLVSFVWCLFASFLYIQGGHYNVALTLLSIIGSVVGASLGSRVGRNKGSAFVKTLFMLVGSVLGLRLLLGV